MNGIQLAAGDWSALAAVAATVETGSVAAAATHLGCTASAVSHALARLRRNLGDPLIIRRPGGWEPTPRARRIAAEFARTQRSLEHALRPGALPWQGRLSIALPDFAAALLDHLVPAVRRRGPGVTLVVERPAADLHRRLATGELHAAVIPTATELPANLRARTLGRMPWVVCCRGDHPAIEDWSATTYAAAAHLQVALVPGHACPLDGPLAKAGIERRVAVTVPDFLLAPPLIAGSDLLMTVPEGLVSHLAPGLGLRVMPLPVRIPPIVLEVVSAAADADEPIRRWFLESIREAHAAAALAPLAIVPKRRLG